VTPTRFGDLLRVLTQHRVEYILVGGIAAAAHGSVRATYDLDVVYARGGDNIKKVVAALKPLDPYLRGAPPGLPFSWDTETVQRGLNFTLTTSLGSIDLFGEIIGGGAYEDLRSDTTTVHVFDVDCQVLTLDKLIAVKRAAGRPKDLEVIAELEAIAEEQQR